MNDSQLRRDLPIPLYYQLMCFLRQAIESGTWKAGEQLPSESQFAENFGISKITVRQALQRLADSGYVRREHGRGTFVAKPKIDEGPRELTSFTEEVRRRGLAPGSRILESSTRVADSRVAGLLKIEPGHRVLVLKRLRVADGQTLAVQTAHLPAELIPGLAESITEDMSLYEVLQKRFGLQPAKARETYLVELAGPTDAELLGVPVGAPVFSAERVTLLSTGQPIEFVQGVLRGDRYCINLELVAESSPLAIRESENR